MTTSAGLTFLSWVRTGLISNAAPAAATGNLLDAPLPRTATLPVTLALEGGGEVGYHASVAGPGDVVGFDTRQVIRMDPAPGATGVEPNYFTLVEFDRPDIPWMLTPNAPADTPWSADPRVDARRGLRPWICLVVVPDRALDAPTAARPLPRLVVSNAELPELEEVWLWAHAQVLTGTGHTLEELLASHPERTLSRLVSPRRLQPSRSYLACVVPTFEAGRRAGLGLDPAPGDTLAPAWTRGAVPHDVHLPVYHSWRFSTSEQAGDFEALAERLRPTSFGQAGVRTLDVGYAGAGLGGPRGGEPSWEMELEGVIVGHQIPVGRWDAPWAGTLKERIALRLESNADELAPPTYGSLQAGHAGALGGEEVPEWLPGLNLDPRYRATASVGTRVVQQHQEALMASAWEQSAGIREANRVLRQAQLAATVGTVLADRVKAAPAGRLLQMTRAVHGQVAAAGTAAARAQLRTADGTGDGDRATRMLADDATVEAEVRANVSVEAAVSGAFRRVARPTGPLARRLAPDARLDAPVERLGMPAGEPGALRPTPELQRPAGSVELGEVAEHGSESLSTLTAARVSQPRFEWEQAGSGSGTERQLLPVGYLADLQIVTRDWESGRTSAAVAGSLDFEGAPQKGWQRLAEWGWPRGEAQTHVDVGGDTGRLIARGERYTRYGEEKLGLFTDGIPGHLREPGTKSTALQDELPITHLPLDMAVAATRDPRYEGARAVLAWVDPSLATRVSFHGSVAPTGGGVIGGWTAPRTLTTGSTRAPSIAVVGTWLFTCSARTIGIHDFAGGGVERVGSVDLAPWLPHDVAEGAAIAVADFGGGTGADVLVAYVAGPGERRRAEYRIAYDLTPDGRVGSWGPVHPVPLEVAGTDVMILMGAGTATLAAERSRMAFYFRGAAFRTQERQERLAPQAAPPPPPPGVDTGALAADVRGALDPRARVEAAIRERLTLEKPIPEGVRDPLQPLAIVPRFPYPTYELFRDAFQDRLFPGARGIPDDCVTALRVNRAALEAFLVGLNHEMSRELLWRGFPVRHGTFFREFWDARRPEITPIEGWTGGGLGAHGPGGAAESTLLLVVRAELVRRIPDVTLYAVPAVERAGGRAPDLARPAYPLFSGRLNPDLRFFGFNLSARTARGDDGGAGWYFVFQEHPTAPRFGLNEAREDDAGYGTVPSDWSALRWTQVASTADEYRTMAYARAGSGAALTGKTLNDSEQASMQHRWGFSAAHMAHITLQRPVQVAIHASDLIEREDPPAATQEEVDA
jgi:hypothetical protein